MKKLIMIAAFFLIVSELSAQDYPSITQKYRHLGYYSPAMAGAKDFLDVNVGYKFQPAGLDNSLSSTFFNAYFSTGATGGRTAIRGTQTADDFYARRKDVSLKLGYGTAVYSENIDNISQTFNSNTFAVHVPVAERTYLSAGVAVGFNMISINIAELNPDDPNDQVYIDYVNSGGDNTSLHIDAGLGLISDEYYISLGVNNLTNVFMSGNESLTKDREVLVANIMAGYRFFHNNDFEAIAMGMVNVQSAFDPAWNLGIRGRFRQVATVGFNYTGDNSIITQLGVQLNDYLDVGYALAFRPGGNTVNNSAHEIGIGLRFLNHNKYSPIW